MGRVKNKITLNTIGDSSIFKVVPLSRTRKWMNQTDNSFAYRCMPLSIANEHGWAVLNPHKFSVSWNGSKESDGVGVDQYGYERNYVVSHFGEGVITIIVDFIIQTPKGISTYIRGIPNEHVDKLNPLDAIVETDWLAFTFTYNYQFQKPGSVTFEKDQPLFSFFPVDLKYISNFDIAFAPISANQELSKEYYSYAKARDNHLSNTLGKFQKFYNDAKDSSGNLYKTINHFKRIILNKP